MCIWQTVEGGAGTQQRRHRPQSRPVHRRYRAIRHHLLAEDTYFMYILDNILIDLVPHCCFNQIEWFKNEICYIANNFLKDGYEC